MKIYRNIDELIGNTPMLELLHYSLSEGLPRAILAKLEYFNPTGSVKDRAALSMICDAEERGLLKKGAVIIEPTSGNTGVGLAAVAAERGYRVVLTMPDTMSAERIALLAAYGAELVLTDGALGMRGAIEKASELAASIEGAFIPSQFDNPANALAHYKSTGPEIFRDTGGEIDIFVAGVGSGGTLSGTARYLKECKPSVKIVAVEPSGSAVLSGGNAGPHGLMGIGAGFVPANYDASLVDEIVTVSDEEAYSAARALARTEGILVGITSGAALFAATSLARTDKYKFKSMVTLLPDTGERYLSTPLFSRHPQ